MDAHREVNNGGGSGDSPPAQPQYRHMTFEVHREFVVASGQDIRSELFELMDSNVGRLMYVFEANVHVSSLTMEDETVNNSITLEGDIIINSLIGTSNTWVSHDGIHRDFRELALMFSHPTRGFLTGVATGPLIAASPLHATLHIYNGTLDDSYDQGGRWRVPRTDSQSATRFEAGENGLANGHIPNHVGRSHARSNHAASNGYLTNHAGPSQVGSNHAGSNGHLPNNAFSNGQLPSNAALSQAGPIYAGSNGHLPNGHVPNGHVSNHAGPSRARSNHAGSNLIGSNHAGPNNVRSNHDG